MRDAVFYPLVLLAGAATIAIALAWGEREPLSPADIARDGYGLRGDALAQLTASPGTEFIVTRHSGRAVQVASREASPPSAGVFMTLPPAAEATFAERDIRVTWRLRRESGTGQVQLGYFTLGAGDSRWLTFDIDESWRDVEFRFRPGAADGKGFDFAGLWPGVGEPDGAPVLVESVRVRLDD